MTGFNNSPGDGGTNVTPAQEPAATPLISAADLPLSALPTVHLPDQRREIVKTHAREIAESAAGEAENHVKGKLGEDALAHWFGIPQRLNVEVCTDGGDGGFDLQYKGARIDVKTVGREYAGTPQLTVDAYSPLTADYYALVSRLGVGDFRLIGYTPRNFVANSRPIHRNGSQYHVVTQEYLFPFPPTAAPHYL